MTKAAAQKEYSANCNPMNFVLLGIGFTKQLLGAKTYAT